MARNNRLVVPQAREALEQLKFEIANELGITIPQDGYYGNMLTREAGQLGGNITKRLVMMAEQQLGKNF